MLYDFSREGLPGDSHAFFNNYSYIEICYCRSYVSETHSVFRFVDLCLRLFIAVNNSMLFLDIYHILPWYTLEYHVFCKIKEVPEYHWVT